MVRPTNAAEDVISTTEQTQEWVLPPLGENPSSPPEGTTPGSFANRGRVGTPWTFSSPDTPGMPQPSDKTAWDFLPDNWQLLTGDAARGFANQTGWYAFTDSTDVTRAVRPSAGFQPITQL